MSRIPVIIDTDPGHDDVFAIMMALASDKIDVKAITTVCGNSTVENTTKNALNILNYFGRGDIPVAMGCSRPMLHPLDRRAGIMVHGESGLEGPVFEEHNLKPVSMHAVDLIAKVLRESEEKVVLAPLGPLCNIALLFMTYPELKEKIAYISLMGGNTFQGNVTPGAEYNVWVDAESAHVVFKGGVPIVMHSINSTAEAGVFEEEMAKWAQIPTKGGKLSDELLAFYSHSFHSGRTKSVNICDANAIAYIIDPTIYETYETNVEVDITGDHTYGWTVTEFRKKANGNETLEDYYHRVYHRDFVRNCKAVVGVQRERFIDLITESLEKLN